MLALFAAAALAASPPPALAGKPKLLVLDLTAAGGVDPNLAVALSESVTGEVTRRGFFEVVSSRDVATVLGNERQRQMLGCSDAGATSCLAELGGALGARFILSGSLARLGTDAYQLNLQTVDSTRAQPVGRSTRLGRDVAMLREQLAYAVAEATGTPLPPPPSHLPQYALMGGGVAVMLAGTLVGLDALNHEFTVNGQLDAGANKPGVLESQQTYAQLAQSAATERTIALGLLVAGAAAAGGGLYWNLVTPSSAGGVALVPSAGGAALVGVW